MEHTKEEVKMSVKTIHDIIEDSDNLSVEQEFISTKNNVRRSN